MVIMSSVSELPLTIADPHVVSIDYLPLEYDTGSTSKADHHEMYDKIKKWFELKEIDQKLIVEPVDLDQQMCNYVSVSGEV